MRHPQPTTPRLAVGSLLLAGCLGGAGESAKPLGSSNADDTGSNGETALDSEPAEPGCVRADPGAIDFGTVPAGAFSLMYLTVSNPCTGPLLIDQLIIEGSIAFSLGIPAPADLAAGDTVTLALLFAPDSDDSQRALLLLMTSDPAGPAGIVLTANGG